MNKEKEKKLKIYEFIFCSFINYFITKLILFIQKPNIVFLDIADNAIANESLIVKGYLHLNI